MNGPALFREENGIQCPAPKVAPHSTTTSRDKPHCPHYEAQPARSTNSLLSQVSTPPTTAFQNVIRVHHMSRRLDPCPDLFDKEPSRSEWANERWENLLQSRPRRN